MKRITDERLAEIEARRLRVPPENSLPEGEGYPADSALTYELLQALKAERAEVARLKAKPSHHWCMSYWEQKDRAEAAEAEVARLHHGAHRWNTVESDGVLQICRGDHERGTACEYERWVPEAKLRAVGDRIKGKNIFEMRSTPLGSVHDAIGGELEALLNEAPKS